MILNDSFLPLMLLISSIPFLLFYFFLPFPPSPLYLLFFSSYPPPLLALAHISVNYVTSAESN